MSDNKVSLLPYNTFGLEVYANELIELTDSNQLIGLAKRLENEKFLVLGGGSNILFTQDFDGLILQNQIQGIELISETANKVLVEVGAGVVWHDFVQYALAQKWYGIENLSLIPGSVGASPIQNIGAYGVEIVDVMDSVEFYNLDSQQFESLTNAECGFDYRDSIFKQQLKNKTIITKVRFLLSKTPNLKLEYGAIKETLKEMGIENPSPADVSKAVIHIRSTKLPNPKEIGNCGSFFKNPVVELTHYQELKENYPAIPSFPVDEFSVKIPAAWMIEQLGWKGQTFGKIGVHKNQALVLVNYGGGNGLEIKDLAYKIIDSVYDKFGIKLSAEVNMV
jgi:UDP-N-acetylmuramate dehydrogenase